MPLSPQLNIKVLVIDDSVMYQSLLEANLGRDGGLQVIDVASNSDEAKTKVLSAKPDVIILDVELPGMNGIQLTKQLMQNPNTARPIILMASNDTSVFDALHAGAVDFVKKPDSSNGITKEVFVAELANKVKIASVAKVNNVTVAPTQAQATNPMPSVQTNKPTAATPKHVVKHQAIPHQPAFPAKPAPQKQAPVSSVPHVAQAKPHPVKPLANVAPTLGALPPTLGSSVIIALGASTGGTEATLEVLKKLPANVPPILIVQHMPPGFTKMYAERLDKICAMNVKEAEDNDIITPGTAYVAPGDCQMRVVKSGSSYKIRCEGTEKVSGHCPSVDVLFDSVAKESKLKNVGIILTGMGKDGAEGLLKMRRGGAYTIGQNQESCIVYGMPMVAFNLGAVAVQGSIKDIADILINHLKTL